MSDKKQTAVGWIIEQLHNGRELSTLIAYAKEMEKEQIMKAFDSGYIKGDEELTHYDIEQYYNETYGI
jgi:hypothetical protein